MEYIKNSVTWAKDRVSERTSWDGLVLIGIGTLILMENPYIDMLAWVAIAWGAFTVFVNEE